MDKTHSKGTDTNEKRASKPAKHSCDLFGVSKSSALLMAKNKGSRSKMGGRAGNPESESWVGGLYGWSMMILSGLAFIIGSMIMVQRLRCKCPDKPKYPKIDLCRRTWTQGDIWAPNETTSPGAENCETPVKENCACPAKCKCPKIDPSKRKTWTALSICPPKQTPPTPCGTPKVTEDKVATETPR